MKKEKEEIQKQNLLIGQWDNKKQWKNEIYSMWQEIFKDPETFADYYYQTMYEKNRIYTMWAEDDQEVDTNVNDSKKQMVSMQEKTEAKKLCGMIHLNPYQMKLQEEVMELDYIVGVAVDETMRRRGIMRTMLQTTMEEMRKNKKPFTFLMPAKEAYYTPFDFRFVSDRFLCHVSFDKSFMDGTLELVSYTEEEQEKLDGFCHKFWEQFMIAPIRTKAYWEQMNKELLAEKGEILLLKRQNQICGYLTYVMEENTPLIREVVTKESVKEVIETFAKVKEVKNLKVYLDWFHNLEEIKNIGNKMQQVSVETVPTIMFRILDVETMLTKVRATQESSIVFRLVDTLLPENEGVYRWTVTKTNAILEKIKQEETVDIVLTIAELTERLFGYPKYKMHMEQKEDPFFDHIIPLSKIYISEIV